MSDKDSFHGDSFHGSGGTGVDSGLPGPSLAEQARTLVEIGGSSTLSTMSQKHPGFPFGSLMPYGIDADGSPLFLISSMAMHTKNLQIDPRCTLLIVQAVESGESLGAGRVSIMGNAKPIEDSELAPAQQRYLARNPSAKNWIGYADFSLYRLELLDIYFVGGFGIMGWISEANYRQAQPDPLFRSADEIIEHMNEDHADAMMAMAHYFGGLTASQAWMTGIDYLGFSLRLETPDGYRSLRIPFESPLQDAEQCRAAMVNLVKRARAAGDGTTPG